MALIIYFLTIPIRGIALILINYFFHYFYPLLIILFFKCNFFIFNLYNSINKELNPPLLLNFVNSKIIEYIDTNDTQIYGEYFVYILNNTIKINTNNGEKNFFIDYIFSQRNDTNYLKNVI